MKNKVKIVIISLFFVNLLWITFNVMCSRKLSDKNEELNLMMFDAEHMLHDAYYTELSEIFMVLVQKNHAKLNDLENFFVYDGSSILEKVNIEELREQSKRFEESSDVLIRSTNYDSIYMLKQTGIYFFIKDSVVDYVKVYDYECHFQYIENLLDKMAKGELIDWAD